MERSVRRSDLRSHEPTPELDSDDEARERLKRIGNESIILQITAADQGQSHQDNVAEDEYDALEFRLFTPRTGKALSSDAAPKIRLRSLSVDHAPPGFLSPRRNSSYYLAGEATAEHKAQYGACAVEGRQIVSLSQSLWPGSTHSWKVLHLPSSGMSKASRAQSATLFAKLAPQVPSKRTRPGKKMRIRLRTKLVADKARQANAQMSAKAKEDEEREKRMRRNREKKMKKKAREKAKKAKTQGDAAAVDSTDGDNDSDV